VWQRNPDWLDKGLMDFHAALEVPKGVKPPRFAHIPEIDSFAKSEKEIKLLTMSRTFRVTRSPYVMPPGTLKDTEFHREYRKGVGEDADPLMPEELAKTIRDTPRDAELIEMFKTLSGPAPLPAR
jgi:hypothetical protein